MPPNNDDKLRVIIGFKADPNKEKADIDKSIRELSKIVEPLVLKIKLDDDSVREINEIVGKLGKLNDQFKQTDKVSSDAEKSLKKQTEQVKKHTEAVKKATTAGENWRKTQRKIVEEAGKEISRTVVSKSDNFRTQIVPYAEDERTIVGPIIRIDDIEKRKQAELKRIHDEDRAHALAFKEKAKRESHLEDQANRIHDKKLAHYMAERENRKFNEKLAEKAYKDERTHALALLQNQRREQDFLRKRQDLINKIETARMRFGHHPGVSDKLDGLLVDAQSLKSIGDYNGRLKDINTSLGKATVGLKAARQETIKLGDAFKTAMVKFSPLLR